MTERAKRVLVAEDDSAHANVIRFTLGQAGCEVTVAPDGQAAWDLLSEHEFDLVVTDFVMPRMTGQELLERIRRDPRLAGMPVVLLTAKGLDLDPAFRRSDISASAVMHKPFSPKRLRRQVEECLEEYTASR